ncbi:MAG: site-specific integrase [Pseudomonadota bacterium]
MNPLLSLWDSHPAEQFKLFVTSQAFVETSRRLGADDGAAPISDESAHVYIAMFNKFIRWMRQHRKTLSTLGHGDLLAFLASGSDGKRDLNSAIAYRYLRLIERCYIHLDVQPNPAQHAIFGVAKTGPIARDHEMVVLSDEEFARFIAALPEHTVKYPRGGLLNGWKRRRDRAMQLAMLCAGLRVAEVVGMQIDEIGMQPELDGSHKVTVTPTGKHNTSVEHETYLTPFAAAEVFKWLDERGKMGIPGTLLFPANVAGDALDKATVYRQVKATFQRAGIAVARSGGRTLRNTFAAREFHNGTSVDEMVERLGLALERSTETYVHASEKNDAAAQAKHPEDPFSTPTPPR